MNPCLSPWPAPLICGLIVLFCGFPSAAADNSVRDVKWFLRRLTTLEHLPELEESHTAMASTWDRSGGNADGTDFKNIQGTTNLLFDAEGPGCIHRLFTGASEPGQADTPGYLRVDGTRLRIFVDDAAAPLFDYPVTDFFAPGRGPLPAGLVGGKREGWTYPGCLFPIPYAKHCRVEIVNPEKKNWGSYWQITYTTYRAGTAIKSLSWPLDSDARAELDQVCQTWLRVPAAAPLAGKWTLKKSATLRPGHSLKMARAGSEIVRELRISVAPATPEVLRALRLVMSWDRERTPSVDVPIGYFFGHADTGHAPGSQFSSLTLGVTGEDAYVRFPMPYASGAVIALTNASARLTPKVRVLAAIESVRSIPANWGRFHATYTEAPAAREGGPVFGPRQVPAHLVLERPGHGKYVGVILRADWPHEGWWGEGDWLIWTDENGWPPSYHGTGTEEYFNSGWCKFDRKAVSGYVAIHPGHPTEYSFHLNDAFQFQRNIKIAVETAGWDKADQQIHEEHPVWGSTAFWYEAP